MFTRTETLFVALLFCSLGVSVEAKTSGDAVRGQQLYESRCTACHSPESNRAGPRHQGVFGRKAGAVADYDYSPALKAKKFKWTEKTLNSWLADPNEFVPDNKMGFSVPDAKDRADLIAYLKTLKAP